MSEPQAIVYNCPLLSVHTVLLAPGHMTGDAEEPGLEVLVVTEESGPVYAKEATLIVLAPIPFCMVFVVLNGETDERLVL